MPAGLRVTAAEERCRSAASKAEEKQQPSLSAAAAGEWASADAGCCHWLPSSCPPENHPLKHYFLKYPESFLSSFPNLETPRVKCSVPTVFEDLFSLLPKSVTQPSSPETGQSRSLDSFFSCREKAKALFIKRGGGVGGGEPVGKSRASAHRDMCQEVLSSICRMNTVNIMGTETKEIN